MAVREALAAKRMDDKVEATLNAPPPPPRGAPGPLARAEEQVAATFDSVPVARKRQSKEAATAQLARCRVLIEAVDYAAKVISGAGSRLERGAVKFGEATVLQQRQSRIKEGPPPPGSSDIQLMHASLGLIDATGSIGTTLSQLGRTLTSEIVYPLQNLYAQLEQDQESRHAGMVVLQQQEQMCANALAESEKRKEKACQVLQVALEELKDSSNKRGSGWKSFFTNKDAKVEQLAQQQTAAVEELALRTDEANLAHLRRQEGADAFHSMLMEGEALYKSLLQTILSRCSCFWKDASKALTGMSDQLQTGSSALGLNIAGTGGQAKGQKSEDLPDSAEREQDLTGDAAENAPPALATDPHGGGSTDHILYADAIEKPVVAVTATADPSARYAILGDEAVVAQPQLGQNSVASAHDARALGADALTEDVAVAAGTGNRATNVVDEEVRALLSSIPDCDSEMSAPLETPTAGTPVAKSTENAHALASINAADVIVSAEFPTTRQADECAASGNVVGSSGTAPTMTATASADEFFDGFDDAASAANGVELQTEEAVADAGSATSAPAPESTAAVEAAVDTSPKRLNRLLNVIVEESQGPLGMKLVWPPDPVTVLEVIPGGWAAKSGVQAGSELVLLDGLPVAEMDEAALRVALQVRPLCLAVRLPPPDELSDQV